MTNNNQPIFQESKADLSLQAIYDVPLEISAVLGHAELKVNQMLQLNRGGIIELDRKVGDLIDLYVNGKLVAKGEIVLVDDKIGITVSELVKSD